MHHGDTGRLRQNLGDTAQALVSHLLTGNDRDRLRRFAQRKRQFGCCTGFTRGVGVTALSGAAQRQTRDAGSLQLQLPLRIAGGQRVQGPDSAGAFGGGQAAAPEQLLQALSHLKTALES